MPKIPARGAGISDGCNFDGNDCDVFDGSVAFDCCIVSDGSVAFDCCTVSDGSTAFDGCIV